MATDKKHCTPAGVSRFSALGGIAISECHWVCLKSLIGERSMHCNLTIEYVHTILRTMDVQGGSRTVYSERGSTGQPISRWIVVLGLGMTG